MIPGYQRHQSMSPVLPGGGRGGYSILLVVCASFHIAVLLHKGLLGGRLCPRGLLFDKILLKNDKRCS